MAVELVKGEAQPHICVQDMKDGQLAEIVLWSGRMDTGYHGRIVQRCGKVLRTVGADDSKTWPNPWDNDCSRRHDCRVRLLEDGELIRVVNNQGD